MTSLVLTVELTDSTVADAARQAGLLSPSVLGSLVEAELRRRRLDKLFATADRLAAAAPPLSEEEVNATVEAEIAAVRAERRARNARRD